jgi:hypothetical protein
MRNKKQTEPRRYARRCAMYPDDVLCLGQFAGSRAMNSRKVNLLTGKLTGRLTRP